MRLILNSNIIFKKIIGFRVALVQALSWALYKTNAFYKMDDEAESEIVFVFAKLTTVSMK